MKKYIHFLLFLLPCSLAGQALKVYDLRVEQLINPIGLDLTEPRLSWKLQSDVLNTMQTAYEITVSTSPDFNPKKLAWQFKTTSDRSINNKYTGKALTPIPGITGRLLSGIIMAIRL